jgi:hypothetical protein
MSFAALWMQLVRGSTPPTRFPFLSSGEEMEHSLLRPSVTNTMLPSTEALMCVLCVVFKDAGCWMLDAAACTGANTLISSTRHNFILPRRCMCASFIPQKEEQKVFDNNQGTIHTVACRSWVFCRQRNREATFCLVNQSDAIVAASEFSAFTRGSWSGCSENGKF